MKIKFLVDENFNHKTLAGIKRHDVSTFSVFAFERVSAGRPMPGVIEIPETVPMGTIINDLILIAGASEPGEWADKVRYLPLR